MRETTPDMTTQYAGHLLVAHPNLNDPNFQRSVILISAHSEDEGSLGVILNRPLQKNLGELNFDFTYGSLASVPVYAGGPVQQNELILTAWYWEPQSETFRLYFGIDEEKAREIQMMHPDSEFRAFLGYAGWGEGQLEEELEQEAWVVTPIEQTAFCDSDGEIFWKKVITGIDPELGFLADIPDDPSLN